jgi:hypothetical protein
MSFQLMILRDNSDKNNAFTSVYLRNKQINSNLEIFSRKPGLTKVREGITERL